MSKYVYLLIVLAAAAVLFAACPSDSAACSPMPWSFEQAAGGSKAIVYGTVVTANEGGRQATVEVISYAGPGQAPQKVTLPVTEDSRAGGDECPDFSLKFTEGEQYAFFLSDVPPRLALAFPRWITAYPVKDGKVTVSSPRGETDDLAVRLASFAEKEGYAVQQPSDRSPVWERKSGRRPLAVAAIAAAILASIAAIAWLRRALSRKLA